MRVENRKLVSSSAQNQDTKTDEQSLKRKAQSRATIDRIHKYGFVRRISQ